MKRDCNGNAVSAVTGKFDWEAFVEQQSIDPDSMVLGIDEAGRGPVVGPMVYAGAYCALKHHKELLEAGVDDSKALTADRRDQSLAALRAVPTLGHIVKSLSAARISKDMTGRKGVNLNTLSHRTAIEIITEATETLKGKLYGVFVDTVGSPEAYARALRHRFPHLNVVVCSKADSIYPVVSAASIVAKTTRDKDVDDLGLPVGSGYPGDPRVVEYVPKHLHRVFGFHDYIRFSWAPVQELLKRECIDVVFEEDVLRADPESAGQPKISFGASSKAPPKRHGFLTHVMGLQTTVCLPGQYV